MRMLKTNIFILLTIATLTVKSQSLCDTLPFIDCSKNIINANNNSNIKNLVHKFKALEIDNSNPIQIIHIGDSHLQAGFLTEKIKQELFKEYLENDSAAASGFIFPYTIAQTNNPYYYKIDYSGNWTYCKNIDAEKSCHLGLSGITIKTNDSLTFISIKMNNEKYNKPQKYFFDRIKVFHNQDSSFSIKANEQNLNWENGYSVAQLDKLSDSILINISIGDTTKSFELYGIILENSNSKINYHTIGVNGATAQSYLKCEYFSKQLSVINPDLIVISLGTNEAYDEGFLMLEHEYIIKDLILQIKDIAPKSTIIFITPNDHIKENKSNPRVKLVRNNIIKICNEFGLCCWDLYDIMGGNNSMEDWHKKGLTGNDKLHFRKRGYEIQGELFVQALIELLKEQ